MKFYISGALQGSNDLASARRIYEMAGDAVRSAGAVAYVPHLKTDPELNEILDSHSVFTADLEEIKRSDGLIVFLNEPSLGVGAEIAIALSLGKSMLPLVESGKPFSRFVEGLIYANGVVVVEYASPADLKQAIETYVSGRLKTKNLDHLCSAIRN